LLARPFTGMAVGDVRRQWVNCSRLNAIVNQGNTVP
jgi:hypothetical protein